MQPSENSEVNVDNNQRSGCNVVFIRGLCVVITFDVEGAAGNKSISLLLQTCRNDSVGRLTTLATFVATLAAIDQSLKYPTRLLSGHY